MDITTLEVDPTAARTAAQNAWRTLAGSHDPRGNGNKTRIRVFVTDGSQRSGVELDVPSCCSYDFLRAVRYQPGVTSVAEVTPGESWPTEVFREISPESATETIDAFKLRAGRVAMSYAEKNGWCGEVGRALDELGIPRPQKEVLRLTFAVPNAFELNGNRFTVESPTFAQRRRLNSFLEGAGFSEEARQWLIEAAYTATDYDTTDLADHADDDL